MRSIIGRTSILIFFALLLAVLVSYSAANKPTQSPKTHLEYKGAVLAHIHRIGSGYGSGKSEDMHRHLKRVGYDTVQLNTFGYMRNKDQTRIIADGDPTLSDKYLVEEINNLHKNGFKVMLKPHIWIGGWDLDPDNWRSKIDFPNEAKRAKWFESYAEFILEQAAIAESTGTEIFAVGTELVGMSKYKEDWVGLIAKVKKTYSGKLTYAAEGMNATKIEFWPVLDYIGIDAYFPLADKENPTVEELVEGWEKYEPVLRELSAKYDKPVLFTEIGYKSVEGSTIKPWEWNGEGKTSQKEQANALRATHKSFTGSQYLAGIFIWKYFTDMQSYEKPNVEKGFTPYKKLGEKVLTDWFNSSAR